MTLTTVQYEVPDYEEVVGFVDDDFRAYIAVHSTKLGPAIGGCRIFPYPNNTAAFSDVLALSKGMTMKNSIAGLNNGGAKMVVCADKATPELMLKVGTCIEYFNGRYISAEDVGTTVEDMRIASQNTTHIATLGKSGDPSPWTALGVVNCMSAALNHLYYPVYDDLRPIKVWVQGLGKVGLDLCRRLVENGAEVYVSDIRSEAVTNAISLYGVNEYDSSIADKIVIYAPCAMGQVINDENVNDFHFPIICGSANNQLTNEGLAEILKRNNVLYCPDYLVNSGGVINVAMGMNDFMYDFDEDELYNEVAFGISGTLWKLLVDAKERGITPLAAANELALSRL